MASEWLGPGEKKLMEESARKMLLSAWSDVAFEFYDWGLYKAWLAGITGLDAMLLYHKMRLDGGLAYKAAAALAACGGPPQCSLWLDSMVAPLLERDAVILLEGIYDVTRADVLHAIECIVSLMARIRECSGEPKEPASLMTKPDADLEGNLLIAQAGQVTVIAWDGFRGLPYRERPGRTRLPLTGKPPLLLEPEEALAFLSRPWRRGEILIYRDDFGFTIALGE